MAATPTLSLLLCIFSIWAVDFAYSAPPHAPAPAVDCSNLVLNMAECLSFVTNGSTVSKPEGECCKGLKTVLGIDPECLCEAFKSSAQLGVVLNVTKALSLPAACKIHAPPTADCGLSLTPGAPAMAPESSSTPVASGPGSTNEQAPVPAPGSSGSSMLGIGVGSLIIGILVANL